MEYERDNTILTDAPNSKFIIKSTLKDGFSEIFIHLDYYSYCFLHKSDVEKIKNWFQKEYNAENTFESNYKNCFYEWSYERKNPPEFSKTDSVLKFVYLYIRQKDSKEMISWLGLNIIFYIKDQM